LSHTAALALSYAVETILAPFGGVRAMWGPAAQVTSFMFSARCGDHTLGLHHELWYAKKGAKMWSAVDYVHQLRTDHHLDVMLLVR
jgi:hypothetical protein